jgi:type I restriction enzyme S subunit
MTTYKLGDITDFNKRTINKSDSFKEIFYLDTSSITENFISDTTIIDINNAPSRAQRRVENNTIVYSTVRPRLKHYGLLRKPQINLIVSTGFITTDIKNQYKNDIDPRYLYLLLTQPSITEYVGNIADTAVSAYPSIKPSDIENLEIDIPDLETQRKIAAILMGIDEKIRINTSINKNLAA